eukprot:399540-Hanusia_phi.AAC.2
MDVVEYKFVKLDEHGAIMEWEPLESNRCLENSLKLPVNTYVLEGNSFFQEILRAKPWTTGSTEKFLGSLYALCFDARECLCLISSLFARNKGIRRNQCVRSMKVEQRLSLRGFVTLCVQKYKCILMITMDTPR